tara:strand:+ start:1477 stop:1782 length:306 start_codon:yes stop_codon:yes gene_type:complete
MKITYGNHLATYLDKNYSNKFTHCKEDYDSINWIEGFTPPSKDIVDKGVKEIETNYSAQEYARKREAEYPSIQECVHAILDDDLTALQEKRQAIKTKYPKS